MVQIDRFDISPDDPATFGPFTVTLAHDLSPENPWEAWHAQTPVIYTGGSDGLTVHDSGDDLLSFFSHVSPAWVSRHWRKLAAILDETEEDADRMAREYAADVSTDMGDARLEVYRESWDSYVRYSGYTVRVLEKLESLYKLAGWPVLRKTVCGYSQSDWADVLLVATPAHAARCGYDFAAPGFDMAESLKGDAELLRSWMFGDVYGYTVEGPDGETVDSCWGFYGCYFDGDPAGGGYVLEQAAEAVEQGAKDWHEKAAAQEAEARAAFLQTRAEWKEARRHVTAAPGALCAALGRELRRMAREWKEARKLRRDCAAILAA
jgi:hypothetical protein